MLARAGRLCTPRGIFDLNVTISQHEHRLEGGEHAIIIAGQRGGGRQLNNKPFMGFGHNIQTTSNVPNKRYIKIKIENTYDDNNMMLFVLLLPLTIPELRAMRSPLTRDYSPPKRLRRRTSLKGLPPISKLI